MRIIIELDNGSSTVQELAGSPSSPPGAQAPGAPVAAATKAGATDAGGAPTQGAASHEQSIVPGAPTIQRAGAQSAGPAPQIPLLRGS
jgi:hypothetical protein